MANENNNNGNNNNRDNNGNNNNRNNNGNNRNNNNHGNNNNNRPKKRKVNNPDPMGNSKSMGRYGMKLLRDIAFGKFNAYKDADTFANREFIAALVNALHEKLIKTDIHIKAIEYAYRDSADPEVQRLLFEDKKCYEAYYFAYRVIYQIGTTEDTSFLSVLASKLPNYKYNL